MLNARLQDNQFVAGDYSIADMAIWPWAQNWEGQEQDIDDKPHFLRWLDEVGSRPAVIKGKAVADEVRNRQQSPEEKEASDKILFEQKG